MKEQVAVEPLALGIFWLWVLAGKMLGRLSEFELPGPGLLEGTKEN